MANGSGGFDWAGLPTVVQMLDIADVELLLYRLKTIKLHRPPEGQPEPQE